MSGYRHSNFDPNAYAQPGRPLRPYNKVQWLGVAFQAAAVVAYAYYFAERAGWVRDAGFDTMIFGLPSLLIGMSLVYSRREVPHDPAPELAADRKRWMIITIALCAALIGVAAVIEYAR